jgi:hypothetical protein
VSDAWQMQRGEGSLVKIVCNVSSVTSSPKPYNGGIWGRLLMRL